jgi:hypothetical protein
MGRIQQHLAGLSKRAIEGKEMLDTVRIDAGYARLALSYE